MGIKNQAKDDLQNSLETILVSTKSAIHLWLDKQSETAAIITQNQRTKDCINILLQTHDTGGQFRGHSALVELRNHLEEWLSTTSASNYFFFSLDGTTIASMTDERIGTRPSFIQQVELYKNPLADSPEITLPLAEDPAVISQQKEMYHAPPSIYLTVPLYNENNEAVALFSLQIPPSFDPVLSDQSVAKISTGNFFFFSANENGPTIFRLQDTSIEGSIHGTHLQQQPCNNDGCELQNKIKNIGSEHNQQIYGHHGIDISGYHDCLGKEMVGAWTWDATYKLGFVYQLDSKAAFHSYTTIRSLVLTLFACVITIFSIFFFYFDKNKIILHDNKDRQEESTNRFKAIANAIDDAIVVFDNTGKINFWNQGATTLFGFTDLEANGASICDLIIPEHLRKTLADELFPTEENTQPLGAITPGEIKTVCKDGTELSIELCMNSIHINNQWLRVGLMRDISDRKNVEQSLKLSEARLKEAQHIARIGYWELDIDSNSLQWSEDLFQIFDVDPQSISPTYEIYSQIIHPSDRDQVYKSYIDSVANKSSYDIEYRLKMKNGSIKYVNEKGKSEYNDKGNPTRSVATVQDITERRVREIEFQTLSERLQLATNVAELGIWDWNITTDTVHWDDTMYRLYGVKREDIDTPQQVIKKLTIPEDYKRAQEEFKLALKGKSTLDTIVRLQKPGGEMIYIRSDAKIYRDGSGRAVRMIGTNFDITDNIKKEQELKKLSERLQLATKGAKVGIWDWHIPTNSLFWDESMLSLYGVREKEFSKNYNGWKKWIHKDDKEKVEDDIQKALKGIQEFDTRFRIILKSKQIRHLRSKATVHLDNYGTPLRMVGVTHDISQTINAQEALENLNEELENRILERTMELEKSKKAAMSIMQDANQSRQQAETALSKLKDSQSELIKLHSAVQASPVSVIITDQDGVIEYVNPKFTEVTGYSYEEVYKKNPRILKSEEQTEAFYEHLWQTLKSGKEWHGEFCNRKKDGSIFWEHTSISPIFDTKGEITHFVAVKEDISQKKEAQKELHEALDQAKEATQAKSDFLANMSHEIRTPMNAIIGMTHLALQTNLNAQQNDYISKINSSANSLLNIINDILDFSKIEAGKLTIENIPFNFSEMINDIITLNAGSFAEKNVELLIYLDRAIPSVLSGDPVRISQIFNNLLSNSAKFTEKGEVELSIQLLEWQPDFLTLECSVADSGIGMSKEQTEKLFQKFSQADSSTTRKFGGTGLGLAITKQLVEMMNGSIAVKSTQDKGTEFSFTLQIHHRPERRRLLQQDTIPVNLQNLRILLLHNQNKACESLTDQLKTMSFHVTHVPVSTDLTTQLEKAQEQNSNFELIMVDFSWITQENSTLAALLHEDSTFAKTPTIIISSVKEVIKAENFARSSKWHHILNKPITPSNLFNTVVEAFGYSELKTGKRSNFATKSSHHLESIRGASILLAEDNALNQQVALEILSKAEVEVAVASNGLEVLDLLKEHEFDLILMDIQMPEMDGITTTKKIRELDSKIKDVSIVAMTAHAMVGDRQRSLDAGMQDHITKPINPDELYTCLVQQIDTKRTQLMDVGIPKRRKTDISEQEPSEFPSEIQGLSLTDGLNRIGGNHQLYKKLLQDFLLENENLNQDLKNALENDDRETAIRLAHTLKGTAGNIGAQILLEKASYLEKIIKDGTEIPLKALENLENTLQETLSNILQALPPPEAPQEELEGKVMDVESLLAQLTEFEELLKVNDMEAEKRFQEIRIFLEHYDKHHTERLAKAMEGFDFKKAQLELSKLRTVVQQA